VGVVNFSFNRIREHATFFLLVMPTDEILSLLVQERDRLNRAIEALQGPLKRLGRPPKSAVAVEAVPAKRKERTPTQRKAQAKRMKEYWAKRKKEAARQG
jgi:hypothetical protein